MLLPVDYQKLNENSLFIDVRSPEEFERETIPGAINIPMFDNEERKIIGTLYKQVSPYEANLKGIEIASKKLLGLYKKIYELKSEYKDLVFFCARGGMRSGVISTFMNSMGVDVIKLKGGYKAYRKVVTDTLPELNSKVEYVVIHGNTGTGKTRVLETLRSMGYDVLDLEDAANHRGSLLGNVGLGQCNTQKMFESKIYHTLRNVKNKYVFVEAESKRIGRVLVPEYVYEGMREGKHIFVDADLDFRSNIILEEYTKNHNHKEDIIDSLEKLRKYISDKRIDEYIRMVNQGNLNEVTKDLMIKYYDPMYMNTANKYNYDLSLEIIDIEKSAKEIANWAENVYNNN